MAIRRIRFADGRTVDVGKSSGNMAADIAKAKKTVQTRPKATLTVKKTTAKTVSPCPTNLKTALPAQYRPGMAEALGVQIAGQVPAKLKELGLTAFATNAEINAAIKKKSGGIQVNMTRAMFEVMQRTPMLPGHRLASTIAQKTGIIAPATPTKAAQTAMQIMAGFIPGGAVVRATAAVLPQAMQKFQDTTRRIPNIPKLPNMPWMPTPWNIIPVLPSLPTPGVLPTLPKIPKLFPDLPDVNIKVFPDLPDVSKYALPLALLGAAYFMSKK